MKQAAPLSGLGAEIPIVPVFESRGIKLIALDPGGKPTNVTPAILAIEERSVSIDRIEWQVIDSSGENRPIYFRIDASEGQLYPTGLYRGNWNSDKRALFNWLSPTTNVIDVGLVLVVPGYATDQNRGKTVARIEFSKQPLRQVLIAARERSGDVSDAEYLLNYYPFTSSEVEPDGVTAINPPYAAHWAGKNNHVQVYLNPADTDLDANADMIYNRDTLDNVWPLVRGGANDDIAEYILEQTAFDEWTLRFIPILHGDYDQNWEVNIADLTPIGNEYNQATDWDAFTKAPLTSPNWASPWYPGAGDYNGPFADSVNYIDGSFDGMIAEDLPDPGIQNLENALEHPFNEGFAQYTSDVTAIGIHRYESISHYGIKVYRTLGDEDWDPERSDPDVNDVLTSWTLHSVEGYSGYPDILDLDFDPFPLSYTPTLSTVGWLTGSYWIEIVPVHSGAQEAVHSAHTILSEAMVITHTNPFDGTPPVFLNSNEGLVSAAPSPTNSASLEITFSEATDTDGDEPGILGYNIYVVVDESWTDKTAIEIMDYVRDATSYDTIDRVTEIPDPSGKGFIFYYSPETSGEIGVYDSTNDEYTVTITPAMVPSSMTWFPGRKVHVAVTAINMARDEHDFYTIGSSGYNDGAEDLYSASTTISHDTTGPVWEPYNEVENSDILQASYGVSPSGEVGFLVYYGYARDEDTGVSSYRIYYTYDDEDVDEGGVFEDETLPGLDYVDTIQLMANAEDTGLSVSERGFARIQLQKRYFFIPMDPMALENIAWAVVKAYNGEEEPSSNASVTRLSLTDASSIFKRMYLADDLSPDHFSGDMADKNWRRDHDTEEGSQLDELAVLYATDNAVSNDNGNDEFDPNLAVWHYIRLGAEAHPLNAADWARIPESGNFTISQPLVYDPTPPSTVRDEIVQVSPGSEMSIEFLDTISDAILRIAIATDGTEYGSPLNIRSGHMHAFTVNNAGAVAGQSQGFGESYNNFPNNNYTGSSFYNSSRPVDLWEFGIASSLKWASASSSTLIETPSVASSFFLSEWYAGSNPHSYDHDWWHLRNFGTNSRGSIMESAGWSPYIGSGSFTPTLWGVAPSDTWSPGSGQLRPKLSVIWSAQGLRQGSTNLVFPIVYTNLCEPIAHRVSPMWSWELISAPRMPYSQIVSSAQSYFGTPATITTRNEDSEHYAYVLFCSGTSSDVSGMGIARILRPAINAVGSIGVTDMRTTLNEFPVLEYFSGDEAHYDVIDSCFGSSVLDFRGGELIGFAPGDEDSYIALEADSFPEEEEDILVSQPLAFTFVQRSTSNDWQLWYGEVYNITSDLDSSAVCVLEIVDSVEISDAEYTLSSVTEFKTLWCSIGMSGQFLGGTSSKQIPVILYGVEMDGGPADGVVKVASLQRHFHTPGVGSTAEQFWSIRYKYPDPPAEPNVYDNPSNVLFRRIDTGGTGFSVTVAQHT